jgi:hypothetical protein
MVESPERPKQRDATAEQIEQLIVTIDPGTGAVAKIERVDKAGERRELSDDESAGLAGEDEVQELEVALEEAFEAGVAAALDEDEDLEEDGDEDADAAAMLRRRLRRRLIARLVMRRLIRRRLLQRRLER